MPPSLRPLLLAAALAAPAGAQVNYSSLAAGDDFSSTSAQVGATVTLPAGAAWSVSGTTYISDRRAGGATFTAPNASLTTQYLYLGYYLGTGTAVFDGPSAALNVTGYQFYVGNYRDGTLIARNGALIDAGDTATLGSRAGSTGTVTIDGAGSRFLSSSSLYVGSDGDGVFEATGGGHGEAMYTYLAYGAGSAGTLRVDGAGSTFTNAGYFYVGHQGEGSLEITDGGSVTAQGYGWAYVADSAGSSGSISVSGTGSAFRATNILHLGYADAGTLSITDGGLVEVADLELGANGGSGTINVSGAGSRLTVAAFFGWAVGNAGQATLNVSDGGHIAGDFAIAENATLTLSSGGTVSGVDLTGGTLNIGNGATYSGRLGFYREPGQENRLNVLAGGVFSGTLDSATVNGATSYHRIHVAAGGQITRTLSLTRTIFSGGGTFAGLTVGNASRLEPGDGVGDMTLTGRLTLEPGSALLFELADATSTAGTGWDLISLSNRLTLNGRTSNPITLSIVTVGADGLPGWAADFNPHRDYTWALITGASEVVFSRNQTLLTAFALDLDGFLNSTDGTFSLVLNGTTLALQYVTASPIPESSTYALLAGAAALALAIRRRQTARRSEG